MKKYLHDDLKVCNSLPISLITISNWACNFSSFAIIAVEPIGSSNADLAEFFFLQYKIRNDSRLILLEKTNLH